jgi:phosphoenolpyruvate carboxykinase (ATP)
MSSSPGPESVRPYSPALPLQQDYIRQQIAKQQKGNFHSTSLKMVSSVNKTALHPSGVQPQREHTEIEEELHEKAHIDYDRVAIVSYIDGFLFSLCNS